MRVQRTTEVSLSQNEVTKIAKDYVNKNTSENIHDEDIIEHRSGTKKDDKPFLTFKSHDAYEVTVEE